MNEYICPVCDTKSPMVKAEYMQLVEVLREQIKHCTGCSGTGISNVLTHPNCADKPCHRCKASRAILERYPVTPELERG